MKAVLVFILSSFSLLKNVECVDNSTDVTVTPSLRYASSCYYCRNCPNDKTLVYSTNGWCAMLSMSDSYGASYTLGVAPPGACYQKGCSWKTVSGVYTYVCCCNGDYCNSEPPNPSGGPFSIDCYYCQNCPNPFKYTDSRVRTSTSPNGWCAKRSISSDKLAAASRGAAENRVCSSNTCSYQTMPDGTRNYVCCCNQSFCNTGVSNMKSTVGLLLSIIILSLLI